MKSESKLLKIGRANVKSAIGYFCHNGYQFYVASGSEEVQEWKKRGADCHLHAMSELEDAFMKGHPFRFITWCNPAKGYIVRQGAKKLTFVYTTHKSVIHIK